MIDSPYFFYENTNHISIHNNFVSSENEDETDK